MNFENLTRKSIDEMHQIMQTEEFSMNVNEDATAAFICVYSKILLSNYHKELTNLLKSKGIDI